MGADDHRHRHRARRAARRRRCHRPARVRAGLSGPTVGRGRGGARPTPALCHPERSERRAPALVIPSAASASERSRGTWDRRECPRSLDVARCARSLGMTNHKLTLETTMFPRAVRTRSCIALSLSAILLTACSIDQSAEPRKTVAASRAIASSTPTDHWAQPHFTPNGIKYSDHGAKPSTLRSASAGLTSSALLRRDGSVVVSVMSFDVRDPSTPAGPIANPDYKIYDTRGNKVPATMQVRPIDGTQTSNGKGADDDHAYGNTITFYGAGIYAGYRIVLQGNVRDINGSRTDIVNVADTVKLSPDPSVVKLAAPAQGYANDLVVIDALVKELNGDTGARGNCVLYDGATVIGRANGIWVDAGDEVDCKFAARFSALGVHQLRASIESVPPADR